MSFWSPGVEEYILFFHHIMFFLYFTLRFEDKGLISPSGSLPPQIKINVMSHLFTSHRNINHFRCTVSMNIDLVVCGDAPFLDILLLFRVKGHLCQ
jgi:hypothetical protein